MVSPSGTYDALAFPIALPKRLVNAMLPGWLKDQFLPIPDAVWSTLDLQRKGSDGEEAHIIVVQLGYQTGTGVGPSVMRLFSFHEAKIDIPYLKHYYRRDVTEDSAAFAYKQVMSVAETLSFMNWRSADSASCDLLQHLWHAAYGHLGTRNSRLALAVRKFWAGHDAFVVWRGAGRARV